MAAKGQCYLLLLMLIMVSTAQGGPYSITVTPLPGECTPEEQSCVTLNELATNTSSYISTNTTLKFLGGNHILDQDFSVSNIEGWLSLSSSANNTVSISCMAGVSLKLSNITSVQLSALKFFQCSTIIESVDEFILEDASFCGGNDSETALSIVQSTAIISRSSFRSNVIGTYRSSVGILEYLHSDILFQTIAVFNAQPFSAHIGGAIIITSSEVDISDSEFDSNSAELGGAISTEMGSNITVRNSTFINNGALDCIDDRCHGGALYIDIGSSIEAQGNTFINNTSGYAGGAITLFRGRLVSIENTFTSNQARMLGGALAAYDQSIVVLNTTDFNNNTVSMNGGAAFVYSSRLDVYDCLFATNVAAIDGGAVFAPLSNITISDSYAESNRAGDDGGFMFVSNSTITMSNTHSTNNAGGDDGGVMFILFTNIVVYNSTFDSNEVRTDGGVLLVESSIVTVNGSSFRNNRATRDDAGAMVVHRFSIATVYNSSFENNEAGNDGGAMYVSSFSNATIYGSTFSSNRAGDDGGAMIVSSFSNVTVYDTSMNNNFGGDDGGVILSLSGSGITVHGSSFAFNRAGDLGGVMTTYDSTIAVINSSFDGNNAVLGGALSVYTCTVTVSDSTFGNNRASDFGGALPASLGSMVTILNSNFHDNGAGIAGGVMLVTFSSNVVVFNSSFLNNEASVLGGVLSATTGSMFTAQNSTFSGNSAGDEGGVLALLPGSVLTLNCSTFLNNRVGDDGGVISATFGFITILGSFFHNNRAGDDGGVLSTRLRSRISVQNSFFDGNTASGSGGAMYVQNDVPDFDSGVSMSQCTFVNNSATEGGVFYIRYASLIEIGNVYQDNVAISNGGIITSNDGVVSVMLSTFVRNAAETFGGVIFARGKRNTVTLDQCSFHSNKATSGGVITLLANDLVTVTRCSYTSNIASLGGVIFLDAGSDVNIEFSSFSRNSANRDGGVAYSESRNMLTINNCNVSFNSASEKGGVFCFLNQSTLNIGGNVFSHFVGNRASSGGVLYASKSTAVISSQSLVMANNTVTENGGAVHIAKGNLKFASGNFTLLDNRAQNGGAVYACESKVNVSCQTLLVSNNVATEDGGAVHLSKSTNATFFDGNITIVGNMAISGGGIYASQVQLNFSAMSNLVRNRGDNGGAIHATNSKLFMETQSFTRIDDNSATRNGGGMYLTMSELKVRGYNSYIGNNMANRNGGGLHLDNSSVVIIQGAIRFIDNEAKFGGGVSLERYSQFCGISEAKNDSRMDFVSNRATAFGGALYIDDVTNPDICTAVDIDVQDSAVRPTTECFHKFVFMNLSDNSASVSGYNLFGGLLDRCTVDDDAYNESELDQLQPPGFANFLRSSSISEMEFRTVSSQPVTLCFCRESQPDCENPLERISVNRGNSFSVELIAFDQIHSPLNANIRALLNSTAGGLGEDQQIQQIRQACTELQFDIFSPLNFEELTLSVLGPCNVSGVSEHSIMIEITCRCPIGFQVTSDDDMPCTCGCHQVLMPYLRTECDIRSQSIVREDNFWINYTSRGNTSGYLIHPNCPYDYCHPAEAQVQINLNSPGGSDAQCSSHRSGLLCGSCEAGFSVSLGSTSCLQCPPSYWPALLATTLVVFILSGLSLVALLLVLNLTVSIGTLNAIIFYANIMAANKSSLFPKSQASFASVFISWLNFDLGFDFCFFNGMDTYVKTWFQLAFPAYIILLVAGIIKLSDCSDAFGRLIGRKDPVGTLATLILLSYAKLLQTIIIAFSSATLTYPDSSRETVWLPDASVGYLSGKHVALFLAATLVLIAGLIYTFLLFTWQWFLWCPRRRAKWITNQKLSAFFETYHHPYTPKHRYWTGLLLLIRVLVFLVSSLNPSGDPRVAFLSTTFIMSSLVIYVAMFRVRIYKYLFINILETVTYFNIITVSLFSWFTVDNNNKHQTVVTSLSVAVTCIQLLLIISYHVCRHTSHRLYSKIQESIIYKTINEKAFALVTEDKQAQPAGGDIHEANELLDLLDSPVNTDDYNTPQAELKQNELGVPVFDVSRPRQLLPLLPPEEVKEEPETDSGSLNHEKTNAEGNEEADEPNEQQSALIVESQAQVINDCVVIVNPEYDNAAVTSETGINNSTTYEIESTPVLETLEDIEEESELVDEPPPHHQAEGDNTVQSLKENKLEKVIAKNQQRTNINNGSEIVIPESNGCPSTYYEAGNNYSSTMSCEEDLSLTCSNQEGEENVMIDSA